MVLFDKKVLGSLSLSLLVDGLRLRGVGAKEDEHVCRVALLANWKAAGEDQKNYEDQE